MPSTVWKGYISFGLVSFPVRLHTAARPQTVHFHMLHKKDLSRIREVRYCAAEDKPLDKDEIVRGFEVSKGKYVVVEDDELKNIAPPTATTMEVLQFVEAGAVDPLYFEKSYYVASESSTAKPYTLFTAVLEEANCHAIAKLAMHNREHVVLLRPMEGRLLLHTLYYESELNARNKDTSKRASYTAKELELARSLAGHLTAKFDPGEYRDDYAANVKKLIASKKAGKEAFAVEQPSKPDKVIDLMEALRQSLAQGKKKTPTAAAPRKKRTARKTAAAAA
ncbi:non-homologous end joining protein Ku [Bryobacterales bacterium F-183]|nr:non-homologous end joining protein Ku [Bryobacterales bacterium F-183]